MAKRKNYPGNFEKRSNAYRWRVCVGGLRYRETFHAANQREAEKMARERYRELSLQAERKRDGFLTGVTVASLFDQFEREVVPTLSDGTQRSYADSLKPLRTYFVEQRGNPPLAKVRAAHVQGYLTWRRPRRVDGRKGNVSNRTLAKDRAVLHRIFSLAERLEYREGNPVALTETPKSDGRSPIILSDTEYERLLAACEGRPMLALYVLTLGETGARCKSEVMWIQWDDVDLEEGFLQIVSGRNGHRTKSGKTRWVPMSLRLRQAMREHFARYRFATYSGKQTPWLFHHTISRRHHSAGERIRSLYDGFKNAAKRANLSPDFVQHDLRHRRVTAWLAEEKNPVHVKEAVGHSDLRTTMLYTHLAKEHLRSLVEQEPQREELRDLA